MSLMFLTALQIVDLHLYTLKELQFLKGISLYFFYDFDFSVYFYVFGAFFREIVFCCRTQPFNIVPKPSRVTGVCDCYFYINW